jgi:hypothetical protein
MARRRLIRLSRSELQHEGATRLERAHDVVRSINRPGDSAERGDGACEAHRVPRHAGAQQCAGG